MTAPAVPVIGGHWNGDIVLVRWLPVALAATYNVYLGTSADPTTLSTTVAAASVGSDGWFTTQVRLLEVPSYIAVTSVNAGAEESAKSTNLRYGSFGAEFGRSYGSAAPNKSPRNTSDPFGAL